MKTHNGLDFSRVEVIANQRGYFVDKNGTFKTPNDTIIKTKDKQGYVKTSIQIRGKNKHLYAHRLQAYQMYGEKIYEEGIVCRHLDNDKNNNSVKNICLGSSKENFLDIPREQIIKIAHRAAKATIKYDRDEVMGFYERCKSYKQTMERFNISSGGTLHYILNKRKLSK